VVELEQGGVGLADVKRLCLDGRALDAGDHLLGVTRLDRPERDAAARLNLDPLGVGRVLLEEDRKLKGTGKFYL